MFQLLDPRRFGAAAAIGATALGLAACGSSGSGTPAPSAAIQNPAITRAADVSGAAAGEKVAYTLNETLPSIGKLTVTGTGAFNNSPRQGQMNLSISMPGAASLGAEAGTILSNLKLDLVFDQQSVYAKIPSSLSAMASTFTGGKPWVSVDLAQLAASSKIPGVSSLFNGQTTPTDPAATLKELKEASTDGVTKVGTATVNGVSTTEYKGTLNFAKLSSNLPAVVKQHLSQAVQQAGVTQIPFVVDIDAASLVRRISLSFDAMQMGTKVPVSMEMDFLAYGKQPAPSVPAAADADNLNGLLSKYRSATSSSGGSGSSGTSSSSGTLGG